MCVKTCRWAHTCLPGRESASGLATAGSMEQGTAGGLRGPPHAQAGCSPAPALARPGLCALRQGCPGPGAPRVQAKAPLSRLPLPRCPRPAHCPHCLSPSHPPGPPISLVHLPSQEGLGQALPGPLADRAQLPSRRPGLLCLVPVRVGRPLQRLLSSPLTWLIVTPFYGA